MKSSSLAKKTKGKNPTSRNGTSKAVGLREKQGPIDWSIYGLKSKYRGEKEREDAWQQWKRLYKSSATLLSTNTVVPVAQIDRHPFYRLFHRIVDGENSSSANRTRSRLMMKRFVFDVQELWLTNIQHLREHQIETFSHGGNPQVGEEDFANKGVNFNHARGNGLKNRRDVKAIESLDSQIPSVSQRRAFENAYHTARLPPVKVMLDYNPQETPYLCGIKPIPPSVESLVGATRLRYYNMRRRPTRNGFVAEDVILHIDRLLPSTDYQYNLVQPEVMWRFSIYYGHELSKKYFICPEARISLYLANRITLQSTGGASEEGQSSPTLVHSQEVFFSDAVYLIPSQTSAQVEYAAKVRILVMGFSSFPPEEQSTSSNDVPGNKITKLKIEICAALQEGSLAELYLESSPPEVRHWLELPSVPAFDVEWWGAEHHAEDLWPALVSLLTIEELEPHGSQSALNLCFRPNHRRNTAERVQGALPTPDALACAYELVDLVRLSFARPADDAGANESGLLDTVDLSLLGSSSDLVLESPSAVAPLPAPADDDASGEDRASGNTVVTIVPSNEVPLGEPGSLVKRAREKRLAARPASSAAEKLPLVQPVDERSQWELLTGLWEEVRSKGPNSSLIASGALCDVTKVPGACEIGKLGLWFPDPVTGPVEYTQAAARFFRDSRLSSTDSVLVNMTLMLDVALVFPTSIAWEAHSSYPSPTPAEEVDGTIPNACAKPGDVCSRRSPLRSLIQDRLSTTVMIFTGLPLEGVDYVPLDYPIKPAGFCRHRAQRNEHGYREQLLVTLLGVDPVLPTMVFGITRTGATENSMDVNPRNIWHSTIAITEHINRPRAPKDYHYILANLTSRGANDPTTYTTRMRAGECVGLTSSAFTNFEAAYADVQELRGVFSKQVALDDKIEKIELELKLKAKMRFVNVRRQLQRRLEKKLRKANKSEIGWNRRFHVSTLVEVQRNWERRRDDRTGLFFFRRLPEKKAGSRKQREQFAETCQWEIPMTWDGDPLAVEQSETHAHGAVRGRSDFDDDLASDNGMDDGILQDGNAPQDDEVSELGDEDVYHQNSQFNAKNFKKSMKLQKPLAHGHTGPAKKAQGLSAGLNNAFIEPPDSWQPRNRNSNEVLGVKGVNGKDLDSVRADISVAESEADTIDTKNLEHIAEQLVSSDELMRVIARRLGLSEAQVVPADELSSVFSVQSGRSGSFVDGNVSLGTEQLEGRGRVPAPKAPRDKWADEHQEVEFGSDDDLWSDEDEEAGNFDGEREIGGDDEMPSDQYEYAQMKRKAWRASHDNPDRAAASIPSQVPFLMLPEKEQHQKKVGSEETREDVFGWRRLPRPVLKSDFASSSLKTHTMSADAVSTNTLNTPIFLVPISPVDACKYVPDEFTTDIATIFIPDAKKDMERAVATLERNIRREEDLARNLPTDDLLLFGEAQEFTSVDAYIARQQREDQEAVADPREVAIDKAILAAKSNNIAQMEDALAEDIPINTANQFGCTLLILAAQQGSKRMCKFLLRRGANINAQSLAGNTALHYCYAYSQVALAEYLKSRGADDAIVNVDGLTCYEGLTRDDIEDKFDGEEGDGGEDESGY